MLAPVRPLSIRLWPALRSPKSTDGQPRSMKLAGTRLVSPEDALVFGFLPFRPPPGVWAPLSGEGIEGKDSHVCDAERSTHIRGDQVPLVISLKTPDTHTIYVPSNTLPDARAVSASGASEDVTIESIQG
jgi:hypothetical protein